MAGFMIAQLSLERPQLAMSNSMLLMLNFKCDARLIEDLAVEPHCTSH